MNTKKMDHLENTTDAIHQDTAQDRKQMLLFFEREAQRNAAAKRAEDERADFVGLLVKIFVAYVIITGTFLAIAIAQ